MYKYSLTYTIKKRQPIKTAIIVSIAVLGTLLILVSKASTPYATLNADKGALTSPAVIQIDATASDGKSVKFGSAPAPLTSGGSNMIVGLDAGGWGSGTPGAKDVSNVVKYVRYNASSLTEPISDFSNNGVKIDVVISGPYMSNGVSSLNQTTWVNNALGWYKANCTTTECPMLEVLNEPGGAWFWGSNSLSSTNAVAYANLVKTAYITFHNTYGSSAPRILATYDGSYGSQGDETFGKTWWNSTISSYVDGIIVHPYGGTGSVSQSALGNRQLVTDANAYTGKPVYVTEVGWPTAVHQAPTGDSLQWTEIQQCNNVYNFISWARSTNYVNAVINFNYVDYGTNNYYGILRWNNPAGSNGSQKPSYNGLRNAAMNLPNPC